MNPKINFKKQVRSVLDKYLPDSKVKGDSISSLYQDKQIDTITESHSEQENKQITNHLSDVVDYAEERLSNEELFSFLMNLGKISIEQNQLLLAAEINHQIILRSSLNDQYDNISAYAILTLGKIALRKNEIDKSLKFINKSKKLFAEQNDSKGMAKAEYLLGDLFIEKNNLKKARIHFNNAIEHLDYSKDHFNISPIEFKLAEIEYILGDYNQACTLLHRVLVKFEQFGNSRQIAIARLKLGMVLFQKKEFESALVEFNKCLFLALKVDDFSTLGRSYLKKSQVYNEMGEDDLALAYTEKALEIGYKLNDKSFITDTLTIKKLIELKQKNFKFAEGDIRTNMKIDKESERLNDNNDALKELGKFFLELDKKDYTKLSVNN